jgi:folate-binding protein YgfZ
LNDPALPPPGHAATARFDAPAADFEALRAGPVHAQLDEFGVIEARGPDVEAFLQAQLTNDVAQLAREGVQLNGYCTAKGRLLAVFTAWRDAEAVYLQLPREILPSLLKRLSMFVLRAKVRLSDVSAQWTRTAVFGKGSAAALGAFGAASLEPWQAAASGALRLLRLSDAPSSGPRFLLIAPEAPALPTTRVSSAAWWWTQADAAVPDVFLATQEAFVPQMINLEVLGGVSFRKGCFPGQEVVARSQYLGKLRRRMSVAQTTGQATIGADVLDASGAPVGKIVLAAGAPDGTTTLLFECPVERLAASLHTSDGADVRVGRLPYALHDVTA